MPFRNSILAGSVLVREAIQSDNYVAGVSGWRIARNGDAEFAGIIARGQLSTGAAGTAHWELSTAFANEIRGYTGHVNEEFPGGVDVGVTAPSTTEVPFTTIKTPQFTGQPSSSIIMTGGRGAPNAARELIQIGTQLLTVPSDGASSDPTGQIRAAAMRPQFVSDNNNDTSAQTNSTTYVALVGTFGNPFFTMPYPKSGAVMVHISCDMANDTVGGISLSTFQIRDTDGTGTVRLASSDNQSILGQSAIVGQRANFGRNYLVTGLPTTGVMYTQMLHRTVSGIGTFRRRFVTVTPCM